MAEAIRAVSLESGDVHDGGNDDAIYLGTATLDHEFGVCPNTISVFCSKDGSLDIAAPYVKANQSYYVMNDLSKILGYEDRPYFAGWPYMWYYAEVPILSPSGLTIGSLCVVDNKPREGLDTKGLTALKEIAHAVMGHLELVVSKVQRKRAERMIQGLGLFVDGSDSLRDCWMDSEKCSRTIDPVRRTLTLSEQADREFGSRRGSKVDSLDTPDGNFRNGSNETGTVDSAGAEDKSRLISPSFTGAVGVPTNPASDSTETERRGLSVFSEGITDTTANESMRKGSLYWIAIPKARKP